MFVRRGACLVLVLGFIFPIATACDCNGEPPPECGPPIVTAVEDLEVFVGDTVVLKGSARLPPEDLDVCVDEKDSLVFEWVQTFGPDVELRDADQREASFVPVEPDKYQFRFTAIYPTTELNKLEKVSHPAGVTVTVLPIVCDPPFADAGSDQTLVATGEPVEISLDGTGSYADTQPGCGCHITSCSWSVGSQPNGSNVTIVNADQCLASVEAVVPGEYIFRLEVQDDCGTEDRLDTSTDEVAVTLKEKDPCETTLEVTAIDASTGQGLAGATVTVVDADEDEHTATTDASGKTAFGSLAAGPRKFITVASDQKVDALEMSEDESQRSRFEITTVVDHCEDDITIPVQRTRSGELAGKWGTVTGKVPMSVFDILPHSWKCARECDTDDQCDATQYCENNSSTPCGPKPPEVPRGSCTPKSLLPFFSLGDHNISGQFRVAILTPVFPIDNMSHFPAGGLFAKPLEEGAMLPGNLGTDDTFLNGLAPTLGIDSWGKRCTSTSECPNTVDYVCEENEETGYFQCKDKNPLRNVGLDLPEGGEVPVVLLLGIINVDLTDLLPVLLPMLDEGASVEFDVGGLLGAFKMQTLHACPFSVHVVGDAQTDISGELAALTVNDCWNIGYEQKSSAVPLEDSRESTLELCTTHTDCQWPASGHMCLWDPNDPSVKKCFTPLFREVIFASDDMTVFPPEGGFDPATPQADERLCESIPDNAPFEVLCEEDGFYASCEPRDIRDLPVPPPPTTECSFPYGLALMALDVPEGNDKLPRGGRVAIGFNFNRTPLSTDLEPVFFVPSLVENGLAGAQIRAAQVYMRNIGTLPDGSYEALPGYPGVTAATGSNAPWIQLPEFLPLIDPMGVPDAGLEVSVTFVTEDPTQYPPTVEAVFTAATGLREPVAGQHDLPATVEYAIPGGPELIGLVLSRVNRVDHNDKEHAIVDSWWRIYAPVTTTSITLPASLSPFSAGDEVWLRFWGGAFPVPFDFDLFRSHLILTDQAAHTKDDYALMAP